MKFFTRNFLLTSLFFLVPLFYFFSIPISLIDLATWAAVGVQGIKTGHIPVQDVFSILPTVKMIYPSWGISFVYGGIYLLSEQWGIAFLSLFHKIVLVVYLYFTYSWYLKKIDQRWSKRNLLFIGLFFLGGVLFYTDRPAFVAILPLFFGFHLIDRNNHLSFNKIFVLFCITVMWINIHGSALLMVIMLSWKMFSSLIVEMWTKKKILDYKSFGMALVASSLGLLINPFGLNVFFYAVQAAQQSKARNFIEWSSPFVFEYFFASTLYFVWILFFVFFLLREIKKNNYRLFLSPYFALSMMGLFAIRNTIWTFFLIIPMMVENGGGKNEKIKEGYVFNAMFFFGMIFLCVCVNPFVRPRFVAAIRPERYDLKEMVPEKEMQIIAQAGSNRPIFSDLETGGYVQLKLKNKTFVDVRNLIFSDKHFNEFRLLFTVNNDEWRNILNRYEIGFILVAKNNHSKKLMQKIENSTEWKVVSSRVNYFLAQKIEK